ncbi:MAG TPA: aldo/keto reductase [Chthoniobacterales bacterium]
MKNTGPRPGQEVAQVYVGQLHPSMDRPIKELKGFEKVFLVPGQSTQITLSLDQRSIAFFNTRTQQWDGLPGTYQVSVGDSSQTFSCGTLTFPEPLAGQTAHCGRGTIRARVHPHMNYRRLGKAGVKVSELSLGSWVTFGDQISDDVAEALMVKAYEAGVNFFDNAEGYASGRSELVMGKILKKAGWPRDTWLVSSKVFFGAAPHPQKPNQYGLSRKHVFEACHAALKRLQVEYLDLFFCHRPDPETPMEETVRVMSDLIAQGKVLYWGTSVWSAQEIMEAHQVARQYNLVPPTMEQPYYNLLQRSKVEVEYAPLYDRVGMGTTVWSPLASGLLTGKYNDGVPPNARLGLGDYGWLRDWVLKPERLEKVRALGRLAGKLGLSPSVLAVAWCLKNPHVSTVILGASKEHQLEENLKASEAALKLTPEVLQTIEETIGTKPKDAANSDNH